MFSHDISIETVSDFDVVICKPINWHMLSSEDIEYFGYDHPNAVLFSDPFDDFEEMFKGDSMFAEQTKKDLIFLFRGCWMDPFFYRNRRNCRHPYDCFLPEELGLMLALHRVLNLTYPSSQLPEKVMLAFCVVTGRKDYSLAFEKVFIEIAKNCLYKAPLYMESTSENIHWNITPLLLQIAMEETVPMPKLYVEIQNRHKKDFDKRATPKLLDDDLKLDCFHGRKFEGDVPLSFVLKDIFVTSVIRFPLNNGEFWTRVVCNGMEIAFGDDIANGKCRYCKFKWENRYNGNCPPTLLSPDDPNFVLWDDNVLHENDLNLEETSGYCPNSYHEDGEQKARAAVNKCIYKCEGQGVDLGELIFVDKETSKIKKSDIDLILNEKLLVLIECNALCPCQRKCPYCVTEKGPNKNLKLFFVPGKGWGVVATDDIEMGTLITTYTGDIKMDSDLCESTEFIFGVEFDDFQRCSIDAYRKGNMGRFINQSHKSHDRKSKFFQPNTFSLNIISNIPATTEVGIFAARKIYCGEELTLYYGEHFQLQKCKCNVCLRKKKHKNDVSH